MRRRVLLGGAAAAFLSPAFRPAWAQGAASVDVQAAVAAASAEPQEALDVSAQLQDRMDAFKQSSGLAARERRGEIRLVDSIADVRVSPRHAEWVKARSNAFDRALIDAQSKYIAQQGLTVATNSLNDLFQAANQTPPPFRLEAGNASGQINDLMRKLVGLGSAQVDASLRQLGADPRAFERAAQSQAHRQLAETFQRSVAKQAFGELVGAMPVQTFEGHDGQGNYQIGVVVAVSPAMKEFAQQVLKARGEFAPDPRRKMDLGKVFQDTAGLVNDFGVRRLYDDDGYPVLVGFGQWAKHQDANPATASAYRRAAVKQATNIADAQIVEFLSASAVYSDNSKIEETLEKVAERHPDGYVGQQQPTTQILDGVQTTIRRQAQATITGLSNMRTWELPHPETKAPIIGVVQVWSPQAERNVRAIRDARPAPSPTAAAPTGQGPNGRASVTEGRSLMNASDF